MSRIVYLFGAGASFGKRAEDDKDEILEGLPIVSEFPVQIEKLIEKICEEEKQPKFYGIKTEPWEYDKLKEEFKWLKETSESHQTIDTFAKKLWVTDKAEYERLKAALSAFLTLEQLFLNPDKRYDAFFANILGSSSSKLPNDMSILSWNYDCQFEIAYAAYNKSKSINDIWEDLKIIGKTTKVYISDKTDFSIIKLNGTALTFENKGRYTKFFDPIYGRADRDKLGFVHWSQLNGANNVSNALSFAWEETESVFYDDIKQKVNDTEVLVVIGYSFPYFNREVDRTIVQNMKNLEKVYIQDPYCEDVKESFEAVLSDEQLEKVENGQIKIVPKKNTKQFVIPNEM